MNKPHLSQYLVQLRVRFAHYESFFPILNEKVKNVRNAKKGLIPVNKGAKNSACRVFCVYIIFSLWTNLTSRST